MPSTILIILHVFVDGFDLLHNLMMQIITIILKVVGRRIAPQRYAGQYSVSRLQRTNSCVGSLKNSSLGDTDSGKTML